MSGPLVHHQNHKPPPPIIVNQHYYLGPPAPHPPVYNPYPASNGTCALSKLKLGSAIDLANQIVPGDFVHQIFDDGIPKLHSQATQLVNQGAALNDQIWSKFDHIMTMIDCDKLTGNEQELFTYQPSSQTSLGTPSPSPPMLLPPPPLPASKGSPKRSKKDAPKGQTTAVASTLVSGNYFAKVELYANAKLPLNLPPLRLYVVLICVFLGTHMLAEMEPL
jgi:hypothetical protein